MRGIAAPAVCRTRRSAPTQPSENGSRPVGFRHSPRFYQDGDVRLATWRQQHCCTPTKPGMAGSKLSTGFFKPLSRITLTLREAHIVRKRVMIGESCYWKEPLLKMADRIEKYSQKDGLTDREGAQYERDIFIGYYTVRKLFEAAGKVSDETRAIKLSVNWFRKKEDAPTVDWYNRGQFWDHYDLNECHSEQRDALFVAHRVIHSFIMVSFSGADGGSSGDFFSSDRDKENRLYFVPTSETLVLFRLVGSDYPNFVSWRDEVTGERKWSAPTAKDPWPDG
jgi:hypothetical protein